MPPIYASGLAVASLVLIHMFAGKLQCMPEVPRSRWLSVGGGISVAYAMVHLLPELQEHQKVLEEAGGEALSFLEHHAYLAAMVGLGVFYGIERVTKRSRRRTPRPDDPPSQGIFWLSMGAFAVYNALIGYLAVREPMGGTASLAFYTLAMALHFLANDFGLVQHHRHFYTARGRWILTAAIVVGAVTGALTAIPEPAIALLVAFLSGGIILNVLKEELPEDRDSRFSAFAAGAGGYALLLVLFL